MLRCRASSRRACSLRDSSKFSGCFNWAQRVARFKQLRPVRDPRCGLFEPYFEPELGIRVRRKQPTYLDFGKSAISAAIRKGLPGCYAERNKRYSALPVLRKLRQ